MAGLSVFSQRQRVAVKNKHSGVCLSESGLGSQELV